MQFCELKTNIVWTLHLLLIHTISVVLLAINNAKHERHNASITQEPHKYGDFLV